MTPPSIWLWTLGGAAAGTIAGSFAATLVLRWPAGRSVATGRSSCDGCGAVLAARDLVPILSFAMLRGRCRRCTAPIDPRHPVIELAAAAIGAAALAASPDAAGAFAALTGWLLLALAFLDAAHFWLPRALTVPLLIVGLAGGACGVAPGWSDRLIGGAGGYAALALLATLYQAARGRTGIGGGDALLLAGIGAWLGWRPLSAVVLVAALGGLAAVGVGLLCGRSVSRHDRVPFGTLLAAAAWAIWLTGSIR